MKYVVTDEDVRKLHEVAFEYGSTDENGTGYDFSMEQFDEFARAALESFAQTLGEPVAVPDGWKLVPVEPNGDMSLAGRIDQEDWYFGKTCLSTDDADKVWKAMLSAAPHHQTTEKG